MIFLGIDLGASALKLSAVQQDGRLIAHARVPVQTHSPQHNHAEQNPQDWVTALQAALTQLWAHPREKGGKGGEAGNLKPEDISAISVTAGTHIGVLCDAACAPLRPAIMWRDQRAHKEVGELTRHETAIIAASLHKPNPTWTLAHLRWLWVHEPDILNAAKHLLPAKDWLRHQLTNDITTDISDAVGTQLYNVAQQKWSSPLCALAGITPDILPPLAPSTAFAGAVTTQASARFALKSGTPVYIGSIDTSAEMLGVGAVQSGMATLKLASAGVVSVNCGDPPQAAPPRAVPPISCYPHAVNTPKSEDWYFASGMNSCAPALDWFRRIQLDDMTEGKMLSRAKQAKAGAGGVLFHPYIHGERAPHWNPHLKPSLSGLHDTTTQADLARAAFEGVGYALLDVRHDLQNRTGCKIDAFTLLGGGAQNRFWAQMMCDMQNLPCRLPRHTDAAYGAALHAGLAHGAYPDIGVLTKMIEIVDELTPDPEQHQIYRQRFGVFQAMTADMLDRLKIDATD